MRRLIILSCLIFLCAQPAFADNLADGITAYKQKDYPRALALLRPLADDGNVAAQRQTGLMFFWGQGIKKDDQAALKYFISAASQGAVGDEITLAMFYQHDGDIAKDLKIEGSFGSAGKDFAETRRWLDKAMAQGSAEATRRIGDMYKEGRGTEQDYKQAAAWYTNAAEAGDPQAQYEIGVLYKNGLGVETDRVKAHMWLSLAAHAETKTGKLAGEQRDFIIKSMQPDEIQRATDLAAAWAPKPLGPAPAPPAAPAPMPVAAPAPPPPAPAAPSAPVAVPHEMTGPGEDANSAPAPGQ